FLTPHTLVRASASVVPLSKAFHSRVPLILNTVGKALEVKKPTDRHTHTHTQKQPPHNHTHTHTTTHTHPTTHNTPTHQHTTTHTHTHKRKNSGTHVNMPKQHTKAHLLSIPKSNFSE